MTFTISDTIPRYQYTASAAQTVFSVPFEWRDDTDIAVYVNAVLKVLNTDYTLTGEEVSGGGSATFTVAMAGGEIVTIYRDMPVARTSDQYTTGGQLPAIALEASFDDATMKMQQLEQAFNQTSRVPITETLSGTDMQWPVKSSRLGKYARWDSVAGKFEPADISATYTTLTRSLIGGVLYPQTSAEIGAGKTPTDYSYPPNYARRFGVVADGVTDDYVGLQNTIDVLESANVGGDLILPEGVILINTGITIEKNAIRLLGQGCGGLNVGNNQGTTIKCSANTPAVTMGVSGGGRWNIALENLRVDISTAGSSAIGILGYAVRHPRLQNVRVVTSEGSAAATGQTGVKFDGQGAFCGWGIFDNLYIQGDFTKGIHLRGNAASNGMNSAVFIGGGVYSTRSSIHAGSFGVHIEQGASNTFDGFDFRGFQTNIQCDADADRNYFNVRHEFGDSTNYVIFAAGAAFNKYISSSHSWTGLTDSGSDTVICLQNGFSKLHLQSSLATESISVQSTAVDSVIEATLQNDAIAWSLQVLGTSNDRIRLRNTTGNTTAFQSNTDQVGLAIDKITQTVVTFANADATPTVAGGGVFITTGTTAITDFDDGILGQTIRIKATGNITITYNVAIIRLSGAASYAMTADDTLTLTMYVDQVWQEDARTVI